MTVKMDNHEEIEALLLAIQPFLPLDDANHTYSAPIGPLVTAYHNLLTAQAEPEEPSRAGLVEQLAELQQVFDMRWEADMRAIKRWHAAGNPELTWPDHADLVVWLLGRLELHESRDPANRSRDRGK